MPTDPEWSLLDAVSDAVLVVDHHGAIIQANPAAVALFGWSQDELFGSAVEMLVPEASRDRHLSLRDDFMTRPCPRLLGRGMNLTAVRKNGTVIPIDIALAPVRVGSCTLVVTTVRDLTCQRQIEEKLRQAQKMEAIGLLAGGVAHDFNNILTVIRGYSQLLVELLSNSSPETERCVEELLRASDRATTLTHQLLAFSRRQVLEPVVLDLNGAIGEIQRMLRRLLPENIEIVLRPGDDLRRVRIDRTQLDQVLLNLAINARDAMSGGGILTVQTDNHVLEAPSGELPAGRYVRLRVSDTGCGMDARTRERIFEPFFTTKTLGRGTGLGLSTVHGIVLQSGGHIEVSSDPGRGSCFAIYFPETEEHQTPRRLRRAMPAPARGDETILLVEDDEGVREFAALTLAAHGYTLLRAPSAEEALALARRHAGPIHLLITDLRLKGMSGRELGARLRQERTGIRVLHMSGYVEETIEGANLLLEGVVPLLEKPFTAAILLARVREALTTSCGTG